MTPRPDPDLLGTCLQRLDTAALRLGLAMVGRDDTQLLSDLHDAIADLGVAKAALHTHQRLHPEGVR